MFTVLKLLKKDHFEGQKNVSKGHEQGRNQDLATLLNDLVGNANLALLTSDASAGGAATEALTVTGLKTTDLILSVSQRVKGGATIGTTPHSVALVGWSTIIADGLTPEWTADPGAGAILEILVLRVAV